MEYRCARFGPLWRSLLLLSLLSLGGCHKTQLALFNLPVSHDGYRVQRDVAYGAGPHQTLDIYRPDDPPASGPLPVILFLHGGSWTMGDKDGYRFVGQALTARGMIVMIADFRQYPEARFPLFLEDAAKAAGFAHAHAADYGGDPRALFLMGHSSGAHMAAMLALDRRYLEACGLAPSIFRGVIGLAGPYDFLPITADNVKDIFSPAKDDLALTQPVHFVSPGAPGFLLLHGADDQTVRPANSEHLAARLRAAGDKVEIRLYPHMGHLGVIVDLAPWFRDRAPVLQDIADYITRASALGS